MANIVEAVRRLSYKVDSDEAVRRIESVGAAQKGVTTALKEGSVASETNETRTAALQRRYETFARQQQQLQNAMVAQAVATGAAMAAATAANDNYARSSSHVSDVLRTAAKTAVDHAASWAATAGAIGAGVLIFGSLLAILAPIILAYKAIKEVVTLAGEAWELSGKKLEEHRQIATKAAAADLSTDYFQKISKAATAAKLPVDDITASFKKLADATADKLGGSDLQNRLDQLTKAGNFRGNTGAAQLAQANTTEEKFRAIVALTDQAFAQGERLAALDLTSKFLSPATQEALARDSEYLHRMQEAADKLAATEIVSTDDVSRALELQRRYDAAVAILEQGWHPVQDLLTRGGIELRAAWVGIVEAVASAVDWVTKLVMKIGEIPQTFWDFAKKAAGASLGIAAGVVPVVGPALSLGARLASSAATESPVAETNNYTAAVDKLRAGLQNVNAVQQAVAQANAVQSAVWKDTSKAVDDTAKAVAEARDQYDRAREAVEKHTARMVADRDAVGLGTGAQEEFRARAQLTTAAILAQKEMTPKLTAEIDRLSKSAGLAATDLAKVQVSSAIKFSKDTAFLSQEDVQIASQLRTIYPDVATALTSVEAAEMHAQNAMKGLNDATTQFGTSLVQAFASGKSGLDALLPSLSALGSQLTQIGSKNAIGGIEGMLKGLGTSGFDPVSLGIGAAGIGVSLISTLLGNDSEAKKKLKEAQDRWAKMADQVTAFNHAAAGTGEALVNALQKPTPANENENEKGKSHDRDEHRKAA